MIITMLTSLEDWIKRVCISEWKRTFGDTNVISEYRYAYVCKLPKSVVYKHVTFTHTVVFEHKHNEEEYNIIFYVNDTLHDIVIDSNEEHIYYMSSEVKRK